MKRMLPLRSVDYKVPEATKSIRRVAADGESGQELPPDLLNVKIDFQSGQLRLDGNWNFIISTNRYAEKHWFNLHGERITFNGTVFPGHAVELSDAKTGAAFAVEGFLSDADTATEYTGLLLLDPAKTNKTPGTVCWNLSIYLYNSGSDDCEIKLGWSFYPATEFSEWN